MENCGLSALIRRAYLFLEDGEFARADEYAERVLDDEPENGEAYLVKLLCDLKLKNEAALDCQKTDFSNNPNYKKIVRFGSAELKARIGGYESAARSAANAINAKEQAALNDKITKLARQRANISQYAGKIAADRCYVIVNETGDITYGLLSRHDDDDYGLAACRSWHGIKAVSTDRYLTLGLKTDGTVVAAGQNDKGQRNVGDWRDIVAVASGYSFAMGLKTDGTVVAVGDNSNGQCRVSGWRNIKAIAAGDGFSIGLKTDGTVISTSQSIYNIVKNWRGIVSVKASASSVMGLKEDGTVLLDCKAMWNDIVAIDFQGMDIAAGLTADGRIVYRYAAAADWIFRAKTYENIVAIAAGCGPDLLALHSSGVVMCTGYNNNCASLRVGRAFYTQWGRQERVKELNAEKAKLDAELQSLKGLFTKKRRDELTEKISVLDNEINTLLKYGVK